MLNHVLEDSAVLQPFYDPTYRERLDLAARLSGAKRYLPYAPLKADLSRNAAPFVAYGNVSSHELFSARMDGQTTASAASTSPPCASGLGLTAPTTPPRGKSANWPRLVSPQAHGPTAAWEAA